MIQSSFEPIGVWVKGARLPILRVTLKTEKGVETDLTGLTLIFLMYARGATTPKVSAVMTNDPDQVTNKGKATYSWAAADLDTAGTFIVLIKITSGGLDEYTYKKRLVVVEAYDHELTAAA